MFAQTEAFLMGSTPIHSNKTNKDFIKFNFIIEGEFVSYFTREADGKRIAAAEPFVELEKTKAPTRCVVNLQVKFGQRGTFVDLVGVEKCQLQRK